MGESQPAAQAVSTWQKFAATLMLLASLFLLLSPSIIHVFDYRSDWLRPWMMFSSTGVGLHEVRYYQQLDNERVALNRFKLLSNRPQSKAPGWLRRVKWNTGVHSVGRKLCLKLGPDADVRAVSRLATRLGWVHRYRGRTNLCKGKKPHKWQEIEGER